MLKNDNLKTRDFSPLIERVLAGVNSMLRKKKHVKTFQRKEKFDVFIKQGTTQLGSVQDLLRICFFLQIYKCGLMVNSQKKILDGF